jgi:predicted murein hydrolase (TIGR00659 family)
VTNPFLTAFTIVLTVVLYIISRRIWLKTQNPLLAPLLLSTTAIILILHFSGITFEQYKPGKSIMTLLLGPATVGLALPLYQNRRVLISAFLPVLVGIVCGCVTTVTTAVLLAKWSGLDRLLVASIATKSVTAPIAIDISRIIGGDPAIAVAFVVFTGTLGSMIGSTFLSLCRISHPVARGLAMGVTAHGQGTATILHEGQTQGAMAGVAMALAAVFTSFIAPFFIPWLLR